MFHAARPPRPTGVSAERGFPQLCGGRMAALPRPSPHPLSPPLAAGGTVVRVRGEAEVARGRRQGGGDGAERQEVAVAAGGDNVAVSGGLVGDSAAGVSGLVALEERGCGGGKLQRKRGLEFPARPPPKRRAVSAVRHFPPGCGRDAPPLIVGGDDDGLPVGTAPSSGARPAGSSAREEGGLSLQTAPANADVPVPEKLTASDSGAPVSDGDHRGPEAAEVKSSDSTERGADLVVKGRGRTRPISRLLAKRRMISANRRFPPGCGMDVVVLPLASRGGDEVGLQLEALPPGGGLGALEDGRCSNVCATAMEYLGDTTEAVRKNALDVIVEVQELEEGELPTEPDHVLQENPVTHNNSLHELTAGTLECVVPSMVDAEPPLRHLSNEKIPVNMLEHKGESVSWEVAEDLKVMKKCKGNSPKAASKPPPEDPLKEYLGDKKVSESCSMKSAPLDVEAGVHGDGIMRRMVTFTARNYPEEAVEANHKSALVNLDRPCSMGKEKESVATMSESFAPTKKLKIKGPSQSKYLPMNTISTSVLHSKEKLKHEEASHLEDDEVLNAIAVEEGKLEMYLNDPSWRHMQHGGQTADARSKVRMICRRFQFICRTIVQAVEQGSLKSRRIDLAADKLIRKLPGFTKQGPIVGKVPGVEIGDEFLYRVELAIVGLHRPYQGGIDTTKDINGMPIAISIVASGGYPDDLSSSGEIIYTGSGGKPAGKKENEDQKLVRGNLALKNCIKTETPVRVIHGFKGPNREEGSHSKAKEVSIFTYDGLYHVVQCWQEGLPGSRVFKYRLQRISGQPELPLHVAKVLRKSVARPGLCIADISQGKEKIPICVVNNIDAARPASFKYITRIKGSSLTAKRSHQGCDCTNGCSDSASCACVLKNGGEFPFNFNGAVVHAKPLIYECGPSCRCPPSCHSRVSQHGMKIPLEVFRTTKTGWGVRSLRSISAGSFICEYVGELLHSDEANQRMNDEYLFDIGHNYDIWKGMPSVVPGLSSSGPRSVTMDDDRAFTIDAAEYGNIGRFINHSCSPNLYAQNILWDHDDKRVPHIMFFAAENISPLQELTYDYNYEIDHVRDMNGEVKVKYCHCGSPQCRDRLY
uniref:Histone-lysine N-methyltransferase, H3 lysine-9 specific SUVH6 n=1 Tax=Aegilops tauschii subsp. strangulata TaxID=200361 RepID=A0A452Y4N4_AEGTS